MTDFANQLSYIMLGIFVICFVVLYGEERLQKILSFGTNYPEPSSDNGLTASVCSLVSGDIAAFTAGAEQSDDITMLCIRYLGNKDPLLAADSRTY